MNQMFLNTFWGVVEFHFLRVEKKKTLNISILDPWLLNWALGAWTHHFMLVIDAFWLVFWWKESVFLSSVVTQRRLFSFLSAKICYYSLMLILFHSSYLQSTRVEFDLPEYSVRRRYQDFDWLRNKLEESQPTHLIPVGTKSLQLFPLFLHRLSWECSLNSHP